MSARSNVLIGIVSGIVGGVLAPLVVPGIKKGARPLAKGLIRGGMAIYEKGREVTAHAGEVVEDVMAEIQSEQAEKFRSAEDSLEHLDVAEEEGPNLRSVRPNVDPDGARH